MKFNKRVDELETNENPWPLVRWAVKWGLLFLVGLFMLKIICFPVQYIQKVAQVVVEEIDPRELLRKYQWFKDAHAALDAKVASIRVYEQRETKLKQLYGNDASKWPRDVREEWALQASEVAGLVASYNTLAADYNAQMAKINWRFTNVGGLPQGATETLPREYAPYKETF